MIKAKSETKAKSDTATEAKTEVKTEAKTEAKTDSKTDTKSEAGKGEKRTLDPERQKRVTRSYRAGWARIWGRK